MRQMKNRLGYLCVKFTASGIKTELKSLILLANVMGHGFFENS